MSVTIAVTSGKGGAGKTMFAVNLSALLSMNDARVLILDMNTGLRNVDLCLGLENQVVYDLSDVISGICPIERAMVKDDLFKSLYLLSASQSTDKTIIKGCDIKRVISEASRSFDFIIIDAPTGVDEEWKSAVSYADWAVVMLTQEYASVRGADSVDAELKKTGVSKRFAVINKLRSEYFMESSNVFPSLSEIADMLHMPVAGGILEDRNIHLAMNGGVPVVCSKEGYIVGNFKRMFMRMVNAADQD